MAFVNTMEPVKDAAEGVSAAATMLNNFDIPKGLVREGATEDYHLGYTQWSVIGDTRHKVYYYWTMYDRRMRKVDLTKLDFNAKKASSFPLDQVRDQKTFRIARLISHVDQGDQRKRADCAQFALLSLVIGCPLSRDLTVRLGSGFAHQARPSVPVIALGEFDPG